MKHAKINMNGDTAQSLMDQTRVAYDAVVAAQEAMQRMTLHQRNYQNYVEPSEYWRLDVEARVAHLKAMQDAIDWLTAGYLNLQDQQGAGYQVPQTGEKSNG